MMTVVPIYICTRKEAGGWLLLLHSYLLLMSGLMMVQVFQLAVAACCGFCDCHGHRKNNKGADFTGI